MCLDETVTLYRIIKKKKKKKKLDTRRREAFNTRGRDKYRGCFSNVFDIGVVFDVKQEALSHSRDYLLVKGCSWISIIQWRYV